jgi:hypothetical protein
VAGRRFANGTFANAGDLAVYWSATVSGGTTTDVVRYCPAAPIETEATTAQTAWQYVASKTSLYFFLPGLGQEFYIDVAPSGRIY